MFLDPPRIIKDGSPSISFTSEIRGENVTENRIKYSLNRSFPIFGKLLFQCETKCKTIEMKRIFYFHETRKAVHVASFRK